MSDEVVVECVGFPAGRFRLEGELAYPARGQPVGAVALAGPHPLLGGTRQNKVVRGLGDALAARGLATLRFDYRHTESGGDLAQRFAEFWHTSRSRGVRDHVDDLRGAVEFLRRSVGPLPLALAGYSFGCTLLPAVARSAGADLLILVAPTVGKHDLEGFEDLAQPRLVVGPCGDFAAGEQHLLSWFERLSGPCELLRPWLDGHFFRGHEDFLADAVATFIQRHWGRP
jgi:alpha/beta superfamily hydrolase